MPDQVLVATRRQPRPVPGERDRASRLLCPGFPYHLSGDRGERRFREARADAAMVEAGQRGRAPSTRRVRRRIAPRTTSWRCATSAPGHRVALAREPVHGTVDQGQGRAHLMRDHGGENRGYQAEVSRSFSRRGVQPCRAHPLDFPAMQGALVAQQQPGTWRVRRAARSRRRSAHCCCTARYSSRRAAAASHSVVITSLAMRFISGCIASPASRRALITTGSPPCSSGSCCIRAARASVSAESWPRLSI